MISLRFTSIADWPPLSWLARCPISGDRVEVLHGGRVETNLAWFCEAVWAGEYAEGDFHRTDIVFGSGGRLTEDGMVFVSAASTLDRLHSMEAGDCVWVSNSLPCLLAGVAAELDPAYPHYVRDIRSVIDGLSRYKRTLPTSAGPVRLTYYHNLRWDGRRLDEVEKPFPIRDFGSFSKYRTFLDGSLQALSENMSSAGRNYPYSMLATLSSGYDSPMVAALARKHGLREAISVTQTERGEPDSGEEIARFLGLKFISIERDAWRTAALPEVPFLAGDASGGDVNLKGAEPILAGRVLLTAYHGDEVWLCRRRTPASPDIVRDARSGLSLSEYRLWAGFIHCPVPFIAVRQVRDIRAISDSADMSAWDTGGGYSKPICRRTLEEAGVPGDSYGTKKRHVTVLFSLPSTFRASEFQADYRRWLKRNSAEWLRRGRIPPGVAQAMIRRLQAIVRPALRVVFRVSRSPSGHRRPIAGALHLLASREFLYRYLFPWAVSRAKEQYAIASSEGPSRAAPIAGAAEAPVASGVAHPVAPLSRP